MTTASAAHRSVSARGCSATNDLTVAGAKVDFGKIPGFLDGIAEALKVIIEVGARLHGICRRAKKSIKRSGSAFWARLDGWNALRLAV